LFAVACAGRSVNVSQEGERGGTNGAGADGGTSGNGGNAAASGGARASGGTGGGAGAPAICSATVVASEASNYFFYSYVSSIPVSVKPREDLTFDWSEVTQDLVGYPLNLADEIDMFEFVLWNLPHPELDDALNADNLRMKDLSVVANEEIYDDATSTTLFELGGTAGIPITKEQILQYLDADLFPPDTHTYTAMIATGHVMGQGTRLFQHFRLDPNSNETTVKLTNESTELVWDVDLERIVAPRVPPGTADLTIDWSELSVDGLGHDFVPSAVSEVVVAAFLEPRSELEEDFVNLEDRAEDVFRARVGEESRLSLGVLTNETGEAFAGITANRTWILALMCESCFKRAPLYLTALEGCSLD
jgi:hypothetical protein